MNKYKNLTEDEAFKEVSKLNTLISYKFCNGSVSEPLRITRVEVGQNRDGENLNNLIDAKLKVVKSNILEKIKELKNYETK